MPLVEVSREIPAPLGLVWGLVSDVESYPRLMDHVRAVEIREHAAGHRVIAWEVDCKGFVMKWTEREVADHTRSRIDFHQITGDLARFEGSWQLEGVGDAACRVSVSVLFEIGIPMLSDMLDPVAERAMRENLNKILSGIAAASAERRVVLEPR
jgi:ribosome-associated toxin RatA of RatAB toxin-antitoxin module